MSSCTNAIKFQLLWRIDAPTNLETFRIRWIRARRRMRLTPERIAKARVPAPETNEKEHSARNQRKDAKKGQDARRPPRIPCSRHSHRSWTSTAGSPRSRQTILRASRRRSSWLARTIRLSKDAMVYRRGGGPGRRVGIPRSCAAVVVMGKDMLKTLGFYLFRNNFFTPRKANNRSWAPCASFTPLVLSSAGSPRRSND